MVTHLDNQAATQIESRALNPAENDLPVLVIKPPTGWLQLNLKEMWISRELLYFITLRDLKVKYKQALLGIAWAVVVPFSQMVIFGTIFGKVANLPTNGIDPYLFYLAGLVPWQYFANSLTMASQSMIMQPALLTKVYLPRLFIPAGSCMATLIDFIIALVLLFIIMAFFHVVPALTTFFIPLLMVIALLATLGVSFFFSALNVKYRDVKFVIPFLIQMWMYITVLLPLTSIPEGLWRYLYGLNPMAVVVEGTRWCLMHHYMYADEALTVPLPFPWVLLVMGIPTAIILFLFGLYYFKRLERSFADLV